MGAAQSCRIAKTDSIPNGSAKRLPPRPVSTSSTSTAVDNPTVAPENQRRPLQLRNSSQKRFTRRLSADGMNGGVKQPGQERGAANNPSPEYRQLDIIDLISDDEGEEYEDAPERPIVRQPPIDLDDYDFMADNGFEILPDPPKPDPPSRMRPALEEYGYDGTGMGSVVGRPNNHIVPQPHAANPDPGRRPDPYAGNEDFLNNIYGIERCAIAGLAEAIIDVEAYANQYQPPFGPAAVPGPATFPPSAAAPDPSRTSNHEPRIASETQNECINKVLEVFGDICRDHVAELYNTVSKSSERIIAYIVDRTESGHSYPKAKVLKRKREVDEFEEAVRMYSAVDRIVPPHAETRKTIRRIVQAEFLDIPMSYIDEILNQEGYRLFTSYIAFEKAQRTYDPRQPAYSKLKVARKVADEFKDEKLEELIRATEDEEKKGVLRELQAVRKARQKDDAERQAKHAAALSEEENTQRAIEEGTMLECGCCCDDFPLNRMIHCDNQKSEEMHWFCRGCALKSAEEEAGSGKYELFCMSMDRCTAGFSRDQRAIFLTENITKVLDGNEQETNLRLAGIVNLARCHSCSFAAECPPIEVDFEFRCPNPECREVTCRRCGEKSHTPMTCEEAKKDQGLELHHLVAESMSEGVIRKCNKCASPFIKEEGCNKMTCTRCGNIQCYVCSQNCGYDHFNDTTRGGKQGNCPLFDNSDERHINDRNKAKKERISEILAEHPEYTEEDLDIKMSEAVQKDDEKRRSNNPRAQMEARMGDLMRAREGRRAAIDFNARAAIDLDNLRRAQRPVENPPAVPGPYNAYGRYQAPMLNMPPPAPDIELHGFGDAFDAIVDDDYDPDFMDFLFEGMPVDPHWPRPRPQPAQINQAAQPGIQPRVQVAVPAPGLAQPPPFAPPNALRMEPLNAPLFPGIQGGQRMREFMVVRPDLHNQAAVPNPALAQLPAIGRGNALDGQIERMRNERERSRQRLRAFHNAHPEPPNQGALPRRERPNPQAIAAGNNDLDLPQRVLRPWMLPGNQQPERLPERRFRPAAQNGALNAEPEAEGRYGYFAWRNRRQNEIVAQTARRIQRQAELSRLMREQQDDDGAIERVLEELRRNEDIPDEGLPPFWQPRDN